MLTRIEKHLFRLQLAVMTLVCLGGAFWGPAKVVAFVLGAGLPQAGEEVPRQVPYRGYVEQDGLPVTSSALPMRFRLFGIDGGVQHEETLPAVVVQNGHFAVDLGDTTPFGPGVLRQNFLELEISVGSPLQLLGRQRLLSTAFAHTAANGVPIGGLIPWGRSTSTTAIPDGYWPCDGSTITDNGSPLAGTATPNLSDRVLVAVPPSRANELRGDAGTTWTTSDAGAHSHLWAYRRMGDWYSGNGALISNWNNGLNEGNNSEAFFPIGGSDTSAFDAYTSLQCGHAHSIEPSYFGVIMLMRIRQRDQMEPFATSSKGVSAC